MIYDLTPPISERLQVWPGDPPPRREILADMQRGDRITLSALHTTAHVGAHADAPSHYGRGAPSIEARDLHDYLGLCQIQHVDVAPRTRVTAADLKRPIQAPRLLLATGTYPDADRFNPDFAALDPSLIEWLHEGSVRLVGIDTPSVDLFTAEDLPAHRMFLRHDMAILEGLVLRHVPEGLYELIALPLRWVGCDGSPVRAIVRTLPSNYSLGTSMETTAC